MNCLALDYLQVKLILEAIFETVLEVANEQKDSMEHYDLGPMDLNQSVKLIDVVNLAKMAVMVTDFAGTMELVLVQLVKQA